LLEWEIDSGENAQIERFASQLLQAVFAFLSKNRLGSARVPSAAYKNHLRGDRIR
jgi:hypothetical protein